MAKLVTDNLIDAQYVSQLEKEIGKLRVRYGRGSVVWRKVYDCAFSHFR